MRIRALIGAFFLAATLNACGKPNKNEDNPVYLGAEEAAEATMHYFADNCIARECSKETKNVLCGELRMYDRYFSFWEKDKKLGQRAKNMREAISYHVENHCED